MRQIGVRDQLEGAWASASSVWQDDIAADFYQSGILPMLDHVGSFEEKAKEIRDRAEETIEKLEQLAMEMAE